MSLTKRFELYSSGTTDEVFQVRMEFRHYHCYLKPKIFHCTLHFVEVTLIRHPFTYDDKEIASKTFIKQLK